MSRRNRSCLLFLVVGGLILLSVVSLSFLRRSVPTEIRLADGRIFRIEAVTFGTNHVVGPGDGWLVPLRKVLPARVIQFGHRTNQLRFQSRLRP
jgi:hypothetical protein